MKTFTITVGSKYTYSVLVINANDRYDAYRLIDQWCETNTLTEQVIMGEFTPETVNTYSKNNLIEVLDDGLEYFSEWTEYGVHLDNSGLKD